MSDTSFGIIVEKVNSEFGIWVLFKGLNSNLTVLHESNCKHKLEVGDLIQATPHGEGIVTEPCWPLPDWVWSIANQVMVRTIITYDRLITYEQGKWTEGNTRCVLVTSHDVGIVAVPIQWYEREMHSAGEVHILVYAELREGKLLSEKPGGGAIDRYWRLLDTRITLPVTPHDTEDLRTFTAPREIRAVSALVLARMDGYYLLWSYSQGEHTALLRTEDLLEPGRWLVITVVPTTEWVSPCRTKYTAVSHREAAPFTQPEVKAEDNKITMTLTLTRHVDDPHHPRSKIELWHEYYGMRVSFDDASREWILTERDEFRCIVEVSLAPEDGDERRVAVRAVAPAAMPRIGKLSLSPGLAPAPPPAPLRPRSAALSVATEAAAAAAPAAAPRHAFEDVDDLKAALYAEVRQEKEKRQQREDAELKKREKEEEEKREREAAGKWTQNREEKSGQDMSAFRGQQMGGGSTVMTQKEQEKKEDWGFGTSTSFFGGGLSPLAAAEAALMDERNNNRVEHPEKASTGNRCTTPTKFPHSPTSPTPAAQDRAQFSISKKLDWRSAGVEQAAKGAEQAPKKNVSTATRNGKPNLNKTDDHIVTWYNWSDYEEEETDLSKSMAEDGWKRLRRVEDPKESVKKRGQGDKEKDDCNDGEREDQRKKEEDQRREQERKREEERRKEEEMKRKQGMNVFGQQMGFHAKPVQQHCAFGGGHQGGAQQNNRAVGIPPPNPGFGIKTGFGQVGQQMAGGQAAGAAAAPDPWGSSATVSDWGRVAAGGGAAAGAVWAQGTKEWDSKKGWWKKQSKGGDDSPSGSECGKKEKNEQRGGGEQRGRGGWRGRGRGGGRGRGRGGGSSGLSMRDIPPIDNCAVSVDGFYGGLTREEIIAIRKKRIDASNSPYPIKPDILPTEEITQEWKDEWRTEGWIFPEDRESKVEHEIGEDGWEYQRTLPPRAPRGEFTLVKEGLKVSPGLELLSRRTIVRDALRTKKAQCLVIGAKYADAALQKVIKIDLYIMDGTPAIVVYNIHPTSYLATSVELTRCGNIVNVNLLRNVYGYEVFDEYWTLAAELPMPKRERLNHYMNKKCLEVMSIARCLCPEAQDRHNERYRCIVYNRQTKEDDKEGFVMFTDKLLHNIAYYGSDVNAQEYEDVEYQMVIIPIECLDNHVFWKAIKILFRIPLHLYMQMPQLAERPPSPVLSPEEQAEQERRDQEYRRETHEPVSTRNYFYYVDGVCTINPVAIPRETRIEEILTLYDKLQENPNLLEALRQRTGMNYAKKFRDAAEVAKTAMPSQKCMKREIQVNADFLISIIENEFAEGIFRDSGEKRLWKMLVKTAESIKAFRSTVNNRLY